MPSTVNGIGTWYYGKKNCISYDDYCPSCKRYVTLSSYDTREWFVILFVPIIPLGQKRVVNSCPICRMHKQMPLKKYLKLKDADYNEAMEKYDAHPNDSEAIGNLLGIFTAYRDMESFEALAQHAVEQFPDDAKMLTTVGSLYYNLSQMEPARQYLEHALSLKDDEGAHELLGFVYLRMSKPERAAEHFQHIIDRRIQDKAETLFALVDGYQAQGRHQDALALLDVVIKIDPTLGNQKEYKKTRKLSEKNLQFSKPIKRKQFALGKSQGGEKTPFHGKKAWAIAAGIFVSIFLLYAVVAFYMGKHANVYLVNGLSRSYDVILDGQVHAISGYGYNKIPLPEGTHELKVSNLDISIPPATVEMHSPFWKRPFLDRIYVINPDTIALLQWTKVFYAEKANQAPDPVWDPYIGEVLYVFDGIHLPFKAFPDEISMSGSGPESRVQVSLVDENEISREQFPAVIEHYMGIEQKIDYLKKCVRYEPDKTDYLYILYSQVDPETFVETVQPGLNAVPIRIEWHRMYQTAMEAWQPEYDVQTEYKRRLDAMPDSPELRYLYGRILRDRQEALHWFHLAVEGPNPCTYGYFALGYDAMATADFKNAVSYCEKAATAEPDKAHFCHLYYEMLVADNQLERACDYCSQQVSQENNIYTYTWVREYLSLLRRLGRNEQANQVFEQWCRQNKDLYHPDDMKAFRRLDQLDAVYPAGDLDAIRRVIGDSNELEDRVLLTLHSRESITDELMAQSDSFPLMWMLLFYISEYQLGNEDNASLFLSGAVEQLKLGGYDQRYAADCLSGEIQIDEQKVCSLVMEAQLKAATLTALGMKYPDHRERFFDLAGRLNYKKTFPYHFLNLIHADYSKQAMSGTNQK